MTQKLKDKIRSLRLSGVGYGSIAKQLNIPEDTVKTHCRRNGLTGQITLSKEGPTTMTTTYAPSPSPKNKRASYKHTACTVMGKHSGYMTFAPEFGMKDGHVAGQSVTTYYNYSDDGKSFYNGTESISQPGDSSVIYDGNVTVNGENNGEMKLRIVFSSGSYLAPPRLDKTPDENGLPRSRSYAVYNGTLLDVADMRE